MKYRFKSEVKALDFWKLSMYKTYHAIAGVCNIVFTAAMFGLLFHFWDSGRDIFIGLILFGCVLFPVIQPLCIYLRCVRQVEDIPKDLELEFDDSGIRVFAGGTEEKIPWKKVNHVVKQRDMLAVYTDRNHGYILMERTLLGQWEEFMEYLRAHINN